MDETFQIKTQHKLTDVIKSVTLLDAVNLLSEAWDSVKVETVANCFKHAGFTIEDQNGAAEDIDVLQDVNLPGSMTREELEDHINIDEEADVVGESTDQELMEQVKRDKIEEEDDGEDVPSNINVLDALKVVRSYAQHNVLNNAMFSLREIENHLAVAVHAKKSQSSITSFFSK